MLAEYNEARKLLKKYSVPYAEELACTKREEVLERCHALDFPLVLKVLSPETHKTDKGLVRTGIHDVFDLKRELSKLERVIEKEGIEKKGFLLQEQVKGAEFIVGAKRDEAFGKVLLFGLGGIFVELMRQRSLRVLPVSGNELRQMVYETPAVKFFSGYRGFKVGEKPLLGLMANAARLVQGEKISELDLNPVIANEREALVVDARVVADAKI